MPIPQNVEDCHWQLYGAVVCDLQQKFHACSSKEHIALSNRMHCEFAMINSIKGFYLTVKTPDDNGI